MSDPAGTNFAIPSGQRSGELPGAYTSSKSLVVPCASRRSCGSLRVEAVKGCADRSVPQPVGIRRPNVDHGVMHILRAGRMHFRHLHPLVFGEMRGHDLVCVFHVAIGRDVDRRGHLQNDIRLRDIPALGPLRRGRRIMRIARRSAGFRPMPARWQSVVRVSDGSLEKCPKRGSANHGGIILLCTALAIAGAHGRVCSYVTRGMGATSPGR